MFVSVVGLSAEARETARLARLANGVMTPVEAAAHLGTTENTLRWHRCRGGGPPFHKDGGRYFYLRDELDAYRAKKKRAAPGATPVRP